MNRESIPPDGPKEDTFKRVSINIFTFVTIAMFLVVILGTLVAGVLWMLGVIHPFGIVGCQ